jgi:hypothetical protein
MMSINSIRQKIFSIRSDKEFNGIALKIFRYQYRFNLVYRSFAEFHIKDLREIDHYSQIPFLPISFYRTHKVIAGTPEIKVTFVSSGTTNSEPGKHFVADPALYEDSLFSCFRMFYGMPGQYIIYALLPSYLERKDSSLVYMADKLIKQGKPGSGFFMKNTEELIKKIDQNTNQTIILLGVSFALLDFAEKYEINHPNLTVIETGGMKGRRREMIREELHRFLCQRFHVEKIHSEYGMTELLSQAYSTGHGRYFAPPWLKVLIRDAEDPLTIIGSGKTGGINIIDLANIHTCSFIATQDLGKLYPDGSFEVLGRFDESDVRGCNLMAV